MDEGKPYDLYVVGTRDELPPAMKELVDGLNVNYFPDHDDIELRKGDVPVFFPGNRIIEFLLHAQIDSLARGDVSAKDIHQGNN